MAYAHLADGPFASDREKLDLAVYGPREKTDAEKAAENRASFAALTGMGAKG